MKKKYTSLIAVSLIVVLLLTTAASASFIDGLQYFVTEGYQGREQLLGFFMIFLIFFSVLFGALQKTTFKDQKNASIVIAFCVALISAISIISQIEFSISGFRYVAEGLFFLLLVILIYSLFVKTGMEKHKFFAFILAILIAAFLIFIVNRLIEEGPRNMFEGLGSDLNLGGVGFGREKAKKSLTPEELEDLKLQWVEENLVKKSIEKELNKLKGDIQTTTDPEKYRSIRNELRSKRSESKSSTKRIKDIHNDLEDNNVPEEELAGLMPVEPTPKKGSNIIWVVLIIALTLTGAGIFAANRIRNQKRPETTTTEEKLTEEIQNTLNAKKNVTNRIEAIEKHVGKEESKVQETINKFNSIKAKNKDMGPILNWDPSSDEFKKIEEEAKLIALLIRDEEQLEKELFKLNKIENDLLSDIQKEWGVLRVIFSKLIPLSNIDISKIRDNLQKEEANRLLSEIKNLETLIPQIREQIKKLYGLVGIEVESEEQLKVLFGDDKEHKEKRRLERWDIMKDKDETQLKAYFNKEKEAFKELDEKLKAQIKIIEGMINSLKEIIRKEKEIAKEEEKAKEKTKETATKEVEKAVEPAKKRIEEEKGTAGGEVKGKAKEENLFERLKKEAPKITGGDQEKFNNLYAAWQTGNPNLEWIVEYVEEQKKEAEILLGLIKQGKVKKKS